MKERKEGAVLLETPCSEGMNAWFLLILFHYAMESQAWLGGKEEEIFNKLTQFCCGAESYPVSMRETRWKLDQGTGEDTNIVSWVDATIRFPPCSSPKENLLPLIEMQRRQAWLPFY